MLLQEYSQFQLNPNNADSIFGCGFVSRNSQGPLLVDNVSPMYHCSVLIEGKGILIDQQFNSYPVAAGCAFQQFPGVRYTLYTDNSQPWKEFQITFGKPTMEALHTLSSFHSENLVFQMQIHPHLRQWMMEVSQVAANSPPDIRLETYFELQRLLLTIHLQEDDSDFSLALSVIHFACYTMMKNLQNPPSVKELAKACNLSYGKLSQIFKQYTQSTPLRFLQHYKFCYADRLLHEGASIRDVAALLGYSDQFAFSKQFKQDMGNSPSESRRDRPVPIWDGQSDPEVRPIKSLLTKDKKRAAEN